MREGDSKECVRQIERKHEIESERVCLRRKKELKREKERVKKRERENRQFFFYPPSFLAFNLIRVLLNCFKISLCMLYCVF